MVILNSFRGHLHTMSIFTVFLFVFTLKSGLKIVCHSFFIKNAYLHRYINSFIFFVFAFLIWKIVLLKAIRFGLTRGLAFPPQCLPPSRRVWDLCRGSSRCGSSWRPCPRRTTTTPSAAPPCRENASRWGSPPPPHVEWSTRTKKIRCGFCDECTNEYKVSNFFLKYAPSVLLHQNKW